MIPPRLARLSGRTHAAHRARDLLDDPIRPQQERLRDRDPDRPGGPEVDDQVELDGLLERQVARPGAPQDRTRSFPPDGPWLPGRQSGNFPENAQPLPDTIAAMPDEILT